MKRNLFIAALTTIMSILPFTNSNSQGYDDLWKNVIDLKQKDMPRKVIDEAQKIYDKASKENNFPHLAKSWITIVETKCDIDPDSFLIANFPPFPHKGPVQDAVYNAIMGSAYLAMKDSHISDFDEETQSDYSTKAREHFALALKNKPALAKASANGYDPLIQRGEDSKLYQHDMLSLLTRFVLQNAQMEESEQAQLLGEVAAYYKKNGPRDAYALTQLQYLDRMHRHEDYKLRMSSSEYNAALKALVEETKDIEAGADVGKTYCETFYNDDEKLTFARWAQKQYQGSYCAPYFSNVEGEMMNPTCTLDVPSGILPNQPFDIELRYKNQTQATVEVRLYNGMDKNRQFKTDGKLIDSRTYTLGDDSLCVARRAENLPTSGKRIDQFSLPAGHYIFIARTPQRVAIDDIEITSLRLFLFELPSKETLAFVCDIETGRPVSNASVVLEDYNADNQHYYAVNSKGEVLIPASDRRAYAWACIKGTNDKTSKTYLYYNDSRGKQSELNSKLFTDRAIYRPGQTVHVSAIVYQQHGDNTQVAPDRKFTITLNDANGKKVETRDVVTNEYGSYDCEFVIPTDRLPGMFSISDNNRSSVSFRVEEYKRPTFDVTAKAADAGGREIKIGDTIDIEAIAKTYADVPVQGAQVKYRIETAKCSFWLWNFGGWEELSEGEGLTDDAGRITIPLYLDPKKLDEVYSDQMLRYRVTFDITDMAGETHSASYTTAVSRQPYSLSISANSPFDVSGSEHIVIKARNANGEDVKASGYFELKPSNDNSETVLHKGNFQTGVPIELPSLLPGEYYIKAIATDDAGQPAGISAYKNVSLFDSKAAIPLFPGKMKSDETQKNRTRFANGFFHVTENEFSENKPAEVIFSPTKKDVYVSYMILSNTRIVERGSFELGRELYRLTIPYDASYGDGVRLFIWYARDGSVCNESATLIYVRPEKQLKFAWSTFRDRLYPGQDETWTLTIQGKDGKPVVGAELLATMYDASLDQFAFHSLPFSLSFPRLIRSFENNTSRPNYGTSVHATRAFSGKSIRSRRYDELTEYIHQRWRRNRRMLVRGAALGAAPGAVYETMAVEDGLVAVEDDMEVAEIEMAPAANMAMAKSATAFDVVAEEEAYQQESEAGGTSPAPQLRSNFAETAFFYPHLLSDANGNVSISFTLPESLTEWKFLGLAHDKDVNYGHILATAVSRKDFMVQPNLPRFVREGDKASIATRIINQGEKPLSGTARLRLLDAETEQEVYNATQPFTVDVGQTTAVTFDIDIDDRFPMLICEVSGVSGDFSDGERNYLPVLTSKKYVTEAIPFYVTRDEQEKHIDISSLFNDGSATATHKRLLFEYTDRPEWTVISALDGIKLPAYDCATWYAASLYANVVARRIAQSIPGFENALRAAQQAGTDQQSQLDRNEDLRDIVLKESPWVNDALKEAEQRARMLDLFNDRLMDERIEKARTRLQKLQLGDGSWSWFEGMKGSYYMTLAICEDLAMLINAEGKEGLDDIAKMLEHGLRFLDEKELEHYEYCISKKLPITASNNTLQYLYVSSLVPDHKVSKKVGTMREAYLKDIEKNVRDLTIHGRTVAACVLRTFGHTQSADDFLESAVEYTITKPGMGRYYATDQAYYSWRDYRIPTQLAAMRAIRQSSRSDKEQLLNEMQVWLLRQKQTQIWDNEMNTLSALDFLLSGAGASGKQVTARPQTLQRSFSIDSSMLPTPIDTTRFLAEQLGYVRTNVDDAITASPIHDLTIKGNATADELPVISWGALYAQYLEDMDRLKNQTTGELKVTIKFMKDGKDFNTETETLKVGDKVTLRVIITADRDMDFVQIRAQRPACFEPVSQISGYRWMNGRGGYVSMHDASTDIFFDAFTKGTTTYDIEFRVDRIGQYLSGITTAQCAYAPEYVAHTRAYRITVK